MPDLRVGSHTEQHHIHRPQLAPLPALLLRPRHARWDLHLERYRRQESEGRVCEEFAEVVGGGGGGEEHDGTDSVGGCRDDVGGRAGGSGARASDLLDMREEVQVDRILPHEADQELVSTSDEVVGSARLT